MSDSDKHIARRMKTHPAAEAFPMLGDDRLNELVTSMVAYGFDPTKPIVRYQGLVLDGRNRLQAANVAKVQPVFVDVSEDCNPFEESWKHNGMRRDLEPGQRGAIRKLLDGQSADFEAKRRKRQEDANRKRSEAQKGLPKAEAKERGTSRDVQGSPRRNVTDSGFAGDRATTMVAAISFGMTLVRSIGQDC